MRNLYFVTLSIMLLFTCEIKSQITVSPEIGIYYRPHTLMGIRIPKDVREPELLIGISGDVKISSEFFVKSRISYIFKNNNSITSERGVTWEYIGMTLNNEEMNIDLSILYEFYRNAKVGIGYGMAHKLNTYVIGEFENFKRTNYLYTPYLNYFTFSLDYNIGRWGIMGRYNYIHKPEAFQSYFLEFKNEKNAYTLSVYYQLFGKSNQKSKK